MTLTGEPGLPSLDVQAALRARMEALREPLATGTGFDLGPEAPALLAEAQALGWSAFEAELAVLLAKTSYNRRDFVSGIRWAELGVEAARRAGLPGVQASAWVVLAAAASGERQIGRALRAASEAMALPLDDVSPQVRDSVLTGVCITYHSLDLPGLAIPAARMALEAMLRRSDCGPRERARAYWNLLLVTLSECDVLEMADPAAAQALALGVLPHVEPLLADAAAAGVVETRAQAANTAGRLLARLGRHQEALPLLHEGFETLNPVLTGQRLTHGLDLADCLMALGRTDEALAAARAAEAAGPPSLDRPQIKLRQAAARLMHLKGEHEQAFEFQRKTIGLLQLQLDQALQAQLAEIASTIASRTLTLENRDLREGYADMAERARELDRLARTDSLTGALTRRALDEAFAALSARGQPFALIVLDLDHFKQINDRHSHLVGDRVLQQVADTLRAALRGADSLARFGGEEFVVLLPAAERQAALAVAERLRLDVAGHPWDAVAAGLAVTVSLGVAVRGPAEPLDALLQRADAALYRAKHAGRNRVVWAGDAA